MRFPFVLLVRWMSPQRSQRYVRSCRPEPATMTSASSSDR